MANSASFIGNDTTTQGNWVGTYGTDGWRIANYSAPNSTTGTTGGSYESTANLPAYATTSLSGQDYYVWDATTGTGSNRKLTRPSGLNPLAACWYTSGSNPWSMTINASRLCNVSFYLLDWDGGGTRKNTITVKDADTSSTLVSGLDYVGTNYTNGIWARYTISGNIKFEFLWDNVTYNAVVSAVMFDNSVTKYLGGQLFW